MKAVLQKALYLQIAKKTEDQIRTGVLRGGERIPSVRRAAQQHGVSVSTVLEAYLALENRRLIEARPKSGFFVRATLRQPLLEPTVTRPSPLAKPVDLASLQTHFFDASRTADFLPLGAGEPGADVFPCKKLSLLMASVSRKAGARGLSYDMPPGAETLRRQIARRALDAGTTLSPNEIITTAGCTEALALCLRATCRPGDIVAVEAPAYFGTLQMIEQLGLKALENPMHPREGMDLDALAQALSRQKIAACVAVPNFSNPLGSLMPDANKQRLYDLLSSRDIPLIEDDINGELFHDGSRPRVVHSYDRKGLVLLCGSFSKTLAPGYRVGWVAPGRYYDQVKALKLTHSFATASLPQLVIAEFLANGGYDHHLRSLRQNFARQITSMSEAVAEFFPESTKLTRPQGGFLLWLELPSHVSAMRVHERAFAEKISIAPGPMFSAKGDFTNFIRLNCGHPWSRRIKKAVQTLGQIVQTS
ncbi:MAG TPA: PLP-dependent aminotransferase family protein [Chthoniobacterales bacterium]|jgi:DNA-binding transcriptional MocR family regulator